MRGQSTTRSSGRGEWCLNGAELERWMRTAAGRRHGVVSRAQLLGANVPCDVVDRLVTRGRLVALHRGVYLVGATPPALAREQAALLAIGPNAVLSHTTAAAFHGLLPYPAKGTPVQVTATRGHHTKHSGITIHRNVLSRTEWWIRESLRVTTPLCTLLDLAATAPGLVEPALREAMAQRLVTAEALRSAVATRPGHRGTRRLRRLLDTDPRLTRSQAERRLLRLIARARLPEPETNARVGRWEVDLLWREQRVVVEVDVYATHSSPGAFESDHGRDAELRALGYVVLRFTVRQIAAEPEATIAAIARELG